MDNLVEFPGARSVIGQSLLTDTYAPKFHDTNCGITKEEGPLGIFGNKEVGGGGGACEVLIHLDSS